MPSSSIRQPSRSRLRWRKCWSCIEVRPSSSGGQHRRHGPPRFVVFSIDPPGHRRQPTPKPLMMKTSTPASTATSNPPPAAESFAALFEESLARKEMRIGEVITAEVIRADDNFVVVNAGLKSESYIPVDEFRNDRGEIEVQP